MWKQLLRKARLLFLACPSLWDKKPDRGRAGFKREKETPLFSSRPTDRESRRGYSSSGSYKEEDKKGRSFRNFIVQNLVPKF